MPLSSALVNGRFADEGGQLSRPAIQFLNQLLHWSNVPTNATDRGTRGQVAFDSDYLYICVATNTWKRTPLNTW